MQDLTFAFTLLFCAALLLGVLAKLYLSARQVKHVAQHRAQVPAAFASTVTLQAHQKAADYTLAKSKLGMLELALGTAVLLGWTLLGGLDALNQLIQSANWAANNPLWAQLALLAAFALIGGLIELPLSLYATFGLEERFGFNTTTPEARIRSGSWRTNRRCV